MYVTRLYRPWHPQQDHRTAAAAERRRYWQRYQQRHQQWQSNMAALNTSIPASISRPPYPRNTAIGIVWLPPAPDQAKETVADGPLCIAQIPRPHPEQEESLESLASKLKQDRFVKLHIGHKTAKPFRVQRELLERHSEYFVAALRENTFMEGRTGGITLQDDDLSAWHACLDWLVSGKLHKTVCVDGHLAVQCWILGDKYKFPIFQDLAMMEVLRYIDKQRDEDAFSADLVCEAVMGSPPGSKMRYLMAQEVVWAAKEYGISNQIFQTVDGYGFFEEYMDAYYDWEAERGEMPWECPRLAEDKGFLYRSYMVTPAAASETT